MTAFDIFYAVLVTFISFFLSFRTPGATLFGLLLMFVCYAALLLGLGAFLFHWPTKIRQHKEEKRLLSLPRKTINGVILNRSWKDTGKAETISVPAGYSIGIDGNFASHYKFESNTIYDGASVIVSDTDTPHVYIIRSFKRDYRETSGGFRRMMKDLEESGFPAIEDLGRSYHITYVTDSDGTNYFISGHRI